MTRRTRLRRSSPRARRRPLQAVLLAAVFNLLGPLLLGAAVADTVGSIVAVDGPDAVTVITAALLTAAWHGISRPGCAASRRAPVTRWSARSSAPAGRRRRHPVVGRGQDAGRAAVSPVLGRDGRVARDRWVAPLGPALDTAVERAGARRELGHVGGAGLRPRRQRRAEVGGVIAALLLAERTRGEPRLADLGGRGVCRRADHRDHARRLEHRPHGRARDRAAPPARRCGRHRRVGRGVDRPPRRSALPVSTTQVVASAVVGTGGGRGRWRHIHWQVVRAIGARLGPHPARVRGGRGAPARLAVST